MVEPSSTVTILDEPKRIPSSEEVHEYAEFLGIDPQREPELLWIAREGVVAPVPPPWKACTENGDDIFYFNFETAESVWDHPCDAKYREMVEEHRDLGRHADKRAGAEGAASCALTRQTESAPRALAMREATGESSKRLQGAVEGGLDRPSQQRSQRRHLGGEGSSVAAGLDRQEQLALIRREISDEESDADAVAAGVLDVELTSPHGASHDQEAAIQHLRQRGQEGPHVVDALMRLAEQHNEGGAAAERKEVLERALGIHERRGSSADAGVMAQLLEGLADAHGVLGESQARRRMLERMAELRAGPQLGCSSPDRGLAGVGLAPVGRAREPEGDSDEDAASSSSSSSGRGSTKRRKGNALRSHGDKIGISRYAAQLDNPLELSGQSGVSGKNSSALSEISEDLALELDNSLSSSQLGLGGRATDTLELSSSALDASSETAVLDAAAEAWARQTLNSTGAHSCSERLAGSTASAAPTSAVEGEAGRWLQVQGDVKALFRTVMMLKNIREQQKEYLTLVEAML